MSTNHTPQFADLGTVEEFAANIKSKWVVCRSDGHDMRPYDVDVSSDDVRVRIKKCRRCNAVREQTVQRGTGVILHTKITYEDGYQMPRGTGRLDSEGRGVFREMALDFEAEQMAARHR